MKKWKSLLKALSCLLVLPSIGVATWNIRDDKITEKSAKEYTPVAYSDQYGKYYTSVKTALDSASSGTVYILPGSGASLTSDATVKSGVTLCLPLSFSLSGSTVTAPWDGHVKANDDTYVGTQSKDSQSNFASDSDSARVSKYRRNVLSLASNLTVNGALGIGGDVGNTNTYLVKGQTSGDYSEITVSSSGSINIYGQAFCYGYIKESGKSGNGSQTRIYSGGSMTLPLVFYDYPGGNVANEEKGDDVFPIKQFDFPNIQSEIRIDSGASFIAVWEIYTNGLLGIGSGHYYGSSAIFGTDNALFKFDSSNSYVIMKYTPYDYRYTNWDLAWVEMGKNTVNPGDKCTTSFDFYGGVTFGSLTIKVSASSMSTADVFLPISWRYKIGLHDGEYFVPYKVKFLPGSSCLVDEDATLTVSSSLIFYQSYPISYSDSYSCKLYPNLEDPTAKLMVNGTLALENGCSFGGFVETNKSTGSVHVESGASLVSESYEACGYSDKGTI